MLTLMFMFFVGLSIGIWITNKINKSSLGLRGMIRQKWRKIKHEWYINKRIKDLAFDPGLVCDMLRREDPEFDEEMERIIEQSTGNFNYKNKKQKESHKK